MENKKFARQLTLLLAATYMVSYLTRVNFGAIVSEIAHATGMGNSALSMALTGSFVCYGVGQLLSGVLGDLFSPKRLVSIGLGVSVLMNLLVSVCNHPWQMFAIWCVNGFAQAFLWPPMVKIMSQFLSAQEYNQAVTKVSWGSSVGTMLIYLLAPVVITATSWRGVFLASAAVGAIMLVIWNLKAVNVSIVKETAKEIRYSGKNLFSPLMLCIMLAIIIQGMLRDGVTTWMPTLIAESFGLSYVLSIFSGVLLPIFSILCFGLANRLYSRRFSNPLSCGGLLFGCGCICAGLLYVSFGRSVVASAFLCAMLTGCMHGVNLMLVCMIPHTFANAGKVSTVSGVLNSCTYIGSAVSAYGIAALSGNVGWKSTIFLWLIAALAGFAICVVCKTRWQKRFMTDEIPGGK